MKVELIKAPTFELDPKKQYLMIFDKDTITREDVYNVLRNLESEGIKGLGVMIKGDPNSIKIVEQKK